MTIPLIKWFLDQTNTTPYKKLSSRDISLSNLFETNCLNFNITSDMLMLVNDSNVIISVIFKDSEKSSNLLLGKTISYDMIATCPFNLTHIKDSLGNMIVSTQGLKDQETLYKISSSLEACWDVINNLQEETNYLLKCLDYLNTAMSIFDKNANLLFINKHYCELFHINDPSNVIGMNINDIMRTYGISISPLHTKSSRLKMHEVLKTGKEVLNWEIILESKFSSSPIQLTQNDILPIFNEHNEVVGIIDIFRSYYHEAKRSKKFIEMSASYTFNDIIHRSPIIDEQIDLAKRMAVSDRTVLVVGESGVGKELFVQSIHNHSHRKNGPFIALNCASFPSELISSELFGYEAGAFTDASKKGQIGKFELANGGTLFLDEISEMPYESQSKLLRVLETFVIVRLGGTKEIPVDVRIIAASNKDLKALVEKGLFREDLYYRLQSLTLNIPPLRRRPEDIVLLSEFFLKQNTAQNITTPKKLDFSAASLLRNYDWPGNVRELKNAMTAISILSKESTITGDTIKTYVFSNNASHSLNNDDSSEKKLFSIQQEISKQYAHLLTEALSIANGNKGKAAELIGVSKRTFYRMMDKYLK